MTGKVFSFGLDLVTVAGILGLVHGADFPFAEVLNWRAAGGLEDLLKSILGWRLCFNHRIVHSQSPGEPPGLSGTHNKFETDSSATRGDLYEWCGSCGPWLDSPPSETAFYGDRVGMITVFNQSFFRIARNADPLGAIIEHRVNRLRHSKAHNPYFLYGLVKMTSEPESVIIMRWCN